MYVKSVPGGQLGT